MRSLVRLNLLPHLTLLAFAFVIGLVSQLIIHTRMAILTSLSEAASDVSDKGLTVIKSLNRESEGHHL
jgi:hypothetical protein